MSRNHKSPCRTPGCGGARAPRASYCLTCQVQRANAAREKAEGPRQFTRTCMTCRDRLPLEEFRAEGSFRNRAYYHADCENCRGERGGSPYAAARRAIERLFALPSPTWMNRPQHPLNRLHYAWMVAINNERAKRDVDAVGKPLGHYVRVRRRSDLSSLPVSYRHALAQGYRPVIHPPTLTARSVA